MQGGDGAGIVGGDRAADRRRAAARRRPWVARRALPATGRVQRVRGGVGDDPVGEREPAGGLLAARRAGRDLAQAGGADQPAVRPGVGVDLPDPRVGVGLLPALLDRVGRDLGRAPAVGVEMVVAGGGGEQQQRLAEGVELELLVDPVADDVGCRPGSRAGRAGAGRGPGRRWSCRRASRLGPSSSSRSVTKRTASSISGCGPALATAWPA